MQPVAEEEGGMNALCLGARAVCLLVVVRDEIISGAVQFRCAQLLTKGR